MTYRVNASIPTAGALKLEGSCCQRGPDASGYRTCRTFGLGAVGGRAAFTLNQMRKLPAMQPVSRSTDGKAPWSAFVVGGTKHLNKYERPESGNCDPVKDILRTHFLFDKTRMRLDRTRTVILPLARDYNVFRSTYLHPFTPPKDFSPDHAGQPLTLRYELNTNLAIPLPSTLVLNGRSTFSVENCKLSRPKVNHPTYNPVIVKDNQKCWSYPDPLVGASSCFIHRISELSSLEGETVRQEKLKKMRKSRKPRC